MTKRRGDGDVEGSLAATPARQEDVTGPTSIAGNEITGLFNRRESGMPSLFEDSVAKGVMAKDPLIFGGTSDGVITINVGVFTTSGTRVRRIVNRETKTILERNSKVLRKNRETKDMGRNRIEEGARERERQRP